VLAAEKNTEDRGLFGRLMELVVDGMRTRPGQDAARPATPATTAGHGGPAGAEDAPAPAEG
jgi:hypothetical protein